MKSLRGNRWPGRKPFLFVTEKLFKFSSLGLFYAWIPKGQTCTDKVSALNMDSLPPCTESRVVPCKSESLAFYCLCWNGSVCVRNMLTSAIVVIGLSNQKLTQLLLTLSLMPIIRASYFTSSFGPFPTALHSGQVWPRTNQKVHLFQNFRVAEFSLCQIVLLLSSCLNRVPSISS